MKKNSKGFTLIELLVVVAIIGILAAVGVVAYNGYTASAKKNAVKTMHAQTLERKLDVPLTMSEETTLTESGYLREHVENIILNCLL